MIWLSRLFLVLTAMAVPFVLESAFELYGLSFVYGPQMLFFSLSHTGGLWVPVLFASAICAPIAALFGLVLLAAHALGGRLTTEMTRASAATTGLLIVHLVLLATYEHWADVALSRAICLTGMAALLAVSFVWLRLCSSNYRLERP